MSRLPALTSPCQVRSSSQGRSSGPIALVHMRSKMSGSKHGRAQYDTNSVLFETHAQLVSSGVAPYVPSAERHIERKKPMSRIPLSEAEAIASQILTSLRPWAIRSSVVGSIRRKEQTIGDIDLLIEINSRHTLPDVKRAILDVGRIHSGDQRKLRLGYIFDDPNLEGDLWICYPPRNFYALQALFTGVGHSQLLRNRLLAKGIERPHAELRVGSEQEFFELAGLPFLPPEQRV